MKIFAVQTPLLDGHQNVGPGIWIEKDIFQKKEKIGKFLKYVWRADASISEHLPVFRAPRKDDGRSAPVHGRVTLHTSPRTQKITLKGTNIYIHRDY